jgi:hypothetical protein
MRIEDGKLILDSLAQKNKTYLPVTASQFRRDPAKGFADPIATLELLAPVAEGRFIQMGGGTAKWIPAWVAISEIALAAWVILSWVSVLAYAPFWLLGGLSKKRRRPTERALRAWPLIAVLSLVAVIGIFAISSADLIARMGNFSPWSAALCLATSLYGVAAVAGAVALWRASQPAIRRAVRIFSMIVIPALLIGAAYLAYWGIIGVRTWA